ncbi:unannotated protein [freshwater metagenome]|uniref:Unannotated protein n=1 Tax=freshwater metagenome TaxID=449393 RepID=A0A6J7LIX7_9ZZZZ
MRPDDLLGPVRVLEGSRAEVDAGASGRERCGERNVIADAAGELDLHVPADICHHVSQERGIAPAPERRIEVDEVNPFGPLIDPRPCGVDRRPVLGLAPCLALNEADCLAGSYVDGGEEDKALGGGHSRNPISRPTWHVSARPLMERGQPGLEERQPGIAGLLRMELGGHERPVLHRRNEVAPVVGP